MSANPQKTRERRSGQDRRRGQYHLLDSSSEVSIPSWSEQRLQFLTRYLFGLLGFIYFNLNPESAPYWIPLTYLNRLLALYCVFNTFAYFKASRGHCSLKRCRFNMWVDLGMVTSCVINDPYAIPVSLLAYAMVIMGNGMRYGMPLFRESIIGAFIGGALALTIRYGTSMEQLSGGLIFLCAFSALIVLYCYVLMERITRSQRELKQLSRYDALTGILNRRGLYESADLVFQLLNRGEHHATIIFADMDRFKAVNDTRGHAEGDRVLREMGKLMRRAVRSSDLVARYGGDEFVLILPEATAEQAARITRTLETGIQDLAAEVGVDFGCSFGVREIQVADTDFHAVLEDVDREMYRAKHGDDPPATEHPSADRQRAAASEHA